MSQPVTIHFEFISCPDCGTIFAISRGMFAAKVRDNANVSCPNGHSLPLSYETPEELAAKHAAREKRTASRAGSFKRSDFRRVASFYRQRAKGAA